MLPREDRYIKQFQVGRDRPYNEGMNRYRGYSHLCQNNPGYLHGIRGRNMQGSISDGFMNPLDK